MAQLQETKRPALRAAMFTFGIGQIVLWIIAIASGPNTWFAWIQLTAGALGLYAALILPNLQEGVGTSSGLVFSLGMIALWIVGLAFGVRGWDTWVSFALDCVLFVGSVYRGTEQVVGRPVPTT